MLPSSDYGQTKAKRLLQFKYLCFSSLRYARTAQMMNEAELQRISIVLKRSLFFAARWIALSRARDELIVNHDVPDISSPSVFFFHFVDKEKKNADRLSIEFRSIPGRRLREWKKMWKEFSRKGIEAAHWNAIWGWSATVVCNKSTESRWEIVKIDREKTALF